MIEFISLDTEMIFFLTSGFRSIPDSTSNFCEVKSIVILDGNRNNNSAKWNIKEGILLRSSIKPLKNATLIAYNIVVSALAIP